MFVGHEDVTLMKLTPATGFFPKHNGFFYFLPDVDGLITQALLTGDFEGAVELCLHDNRLADSIILAIAGGPELLEKTQKKYFTKSHSKITKVTTGGNFLECFLIKNVLLVL